MTETEQKIIDSVVGLINGLVTALAVVVLHLDARGTASAKQIADEVETVFIGAAAQLPRAQRDRWDLFFARKLVELIRNPRGHPTLGIIEGGKPPAKH